MPKYLIEVSETVYHVFSFETDEDMTEEEAEQYFYGMEAEEQEAARLSTEGFEWTVERIEKGN